MNGANVANGAGAHSPTKPISGKSPSTNMPRSGSSYMDPSSLGESPNFQRRDDDLESGPKPAITTEYQRLVDSKEPLTPTTFEKILTDLPIRTQIMGDFLHGNALLGMSEGEISKLTFYAFGGVASLNMAIQITGLIHAYSQGKLDADTIISRIIPLISSTLIGFAGFGDLIATSVAAAAPPVFITAMLIGATAYLYNAYKIYNSESPTSDKIRDAITLLPGLLKIGFATGALVSGGVGDILKKIEAKESITSIQKLCAQASAYTAYIEIFAPALIGSKKLKQD